MTTDGVVTDNRTGSPGRMVGGVSTEQAEGWWVMGETQMAIYRTALDAERKMHEECNADLNRALDTITIRNTKIAQLEERVAELEERNDNLITAIANLQRLYAHIDNAKQQVLG